jgi:hypothetical protein
MFIEMQWTVHGFFDWGEAADVFPFQQTRFFVYDEDRNTGEIENRLTFFYDGAQHIVDKNRKRQQPIDLENRCQQLFPRNAVTCLLAHLPHFLSSDMVFGNNQPVRQPLSRAMFILSRQPIEEN